jgi:hypothetical protein
MFFGFNFQNHYKCKASSPVISTEGSQDEQYQKLSKK